MNINTDEIIKDLLAALDSLVGIRPDELPNIDLYMDQVTTFMDAELAASKRYEDDKVLTKTMINNYAKNRLLPPPEKKKYSREHMIALIFIYYFKNIMSITDIQTLLNPLSEKYFGNKEGFSFMNLYEEAFQLEKLQIPNVKEDLLAKYRTAKETFSDAPPEDQEFLQLFSFLCLMSFDVYLKKQMIEQVVDKLDAYHKSQTAKDGKKENN